LWHHTTSHYCLVVSTFMFFQYSLITIIFQDTIINYTMTPPVTNVGLDQPLKLSALPPLPVNTGWYMSLSSERKAEICRKGVIRRSEQKKKKQSQMSARRKDPDDRQPAAVTEAVTVFHSHSFPSFDEMVASAMPQPAQHATNKMCSCFLPIRLQPLTPPFGRHTCLRVFAVATAACNRRRRRF
jgi:hypothetical protein